MRTTLLLTSIIAIVATISSFQTRAGVIPPTFNNTNCSAVTLTSVTTLNNPTNNLLSTHYNASQCIGFIGPKPSYNDDPFNFDPNNPTKNIGYLGDGLLNGGEKNGTRYFDGSEFIGAGDYQDLRTPGQFIDPGWIHLSNFDADSEQWVYSSAGTGLANGPLDIAKLLDFSISCEIGNLKDCKAGTWQLTTKIDIIEQVQALLGPASFDHLAFSIKAGPSFVVYDFNFKTIFGAENNPLLNFTTPYIFKGDFNTADMRNAGVSHFNVYARDPQAPNPVPAPTTLMIMGFGLICLSLKDRVVKQPK